MSSLCTFDIKNLMYNILSKYPFLGIWLWLTIIYFWLIIIIILNKNNNCENNISNKSSYENFSYHVKKLSPQIPNNEQSQSNFLLPNIKNDFVSSYYNYNKKAFKIKEKVNKKIPEKISHRLCSRDLENLIKVRKINDLVKSKLKWNEL